MIKLIFSNILSLIGIALIIYGIYQISEVAAIISTGIVLYLMSLELRFLK